MNAGVRCQTTDAPAISANFWVNARELNHAYSATANGATVTLLCPFVARAKFSAYPSVHKIRR